MLSGRSPFLSASRTREDSASSIIRRIKNGDFKMEGEIWKYISPAARSLAKGLLTVDPKKRLTLDDLFQSPWIHAPACRSHNNNVGCAITMKPLSPTTTNLPKNYSQLHTIPNNSNMHYSSSSENNHPYHPGMMHHATVTNSSSGGGGGPTAATSPVNLPDIVLEHLFSFLDLASLRACSLVCKSWYSLLNDENNDVWRLHCVRRLAQEALQSSELLTGRMLFEHVNTYINLE